jgi:hypothetical protein
MTEENSAPRAKFHLNAGFHCSRFARAGGADFENLLMRERFARLVENGLNGRLTGAIAEYPSTF